MKVTVLLGPPAAGKGTLAEKLIAACGYTPVSTGDILRAHVAENGQRAASIQKAMQSGHLISAEDFRAVFPAYMAKLPKDANILMDGAPRNATGMDLFMESLESGQYELGGIILMQADPDTLRSRMAKRAFNDAASGTARQDDKQHIFENRLHVFESETRPVMDRLRREFTQTFTVDNTFLKPEETFARVKAYLDTKPQPRQIRPPASSAAKPAGPLP